MAGLTEEWEPVDRTEALHGEMQSAAAGTAPRAQSIKL